MEQLLERLSREAAGIPNTTGHFMTLAENYMREGNTEGARAALILLCRRCDNYEESIEWNGLTDKWKDYRHLVEGLVPPSVSFHGVAARSPEECSMGIEDIFALPEEDLLSALSLHLQELSGKGKQRSRLNPWERIAYFADELCMEVNSGGFDSYLYYHGEHFDKAYDALKSLQAPQVIGILDSIRAKFPRGRIPKNKDRIQELMDTMEETGIDFEAEDALFYTSGEKELLSHLLLYVKENQKHFR